MRCASGRCNLIPLTGTVTPSSRSHSRRTRRCNLIPLTGTVTPPQQQQMVGQSMMQPYTPHGDSNRRTLPGCWTAWMQPYTPHGDSNSQNGISAFSLMRCNLIPLTGTVTASVRVCCPFLMGCNLIPLTGTVTACWPDCATPEAGCNLIPLTGTVTRFWPLQPPCRWGMQPYTPHGDSNRLPAGHPILM